MLCVDGDEDEKHGWDGANGKRAHKSLNPYRWNELARSITAHFLNKVKEMMPAAAASSYFLSMCVVMVIVIMVVIVVIVVVGVVVGVVMVIVVMVIVVVVIVIVVVVVVVIVVVVIVGVGYLGAWGGRLGRRCCSWCRCRLFSGLVYFPCISVLCRHLLVMMMIMMVIMAVMMMVILAVIIMAVMMMMALVRCQREGVDILSPTYLPRAMAMTALNSRTAERIWMGVSDAGDR